jgi:hypothetical protein
MPLPVTADKDIIVYANPKFLDEMIFSKGKKTISKSLAPAEHRDKFLHEMFS